MHISMAACRRPKSTRWNASGAIMTACAKRVSLRVPATPCIATLTPPIAARRDIAELAKAHPGACGRPSDIHEPLTDWWQATEPAMAQFAPADAAAGGSGGNVYALRRALVTDIDAALCGPDAAQSRSRYRGAMARYVDSLKTDLKSVAAAAGERSEFPTTKSCKASFLSLVDELASKRARIDEVQALFAAADEDSYEDEEGNGVLASTEVKRLKDLLKGAGRRAEGVGQGLRAGRGPRTGCTNWPTKGSGEVRQAERSRFRGRSLAGQRPQARPVKLHISPRPSWSLRRRGNLS